MGYDEDDDGIIAKLQQSFFNEKISRNLIDINVWLWYKGCIKDAVFHPEVGSVLSTIIYLSSGWIIEIWAW